MGNYVADETDVQRWIPNNELTIGVASEPTTAEVLALILEVEDEIDAALAYCGYTVPITDTDDINLLGRFVSKKVAVDVWAIAFSSTQFPERIRIHQDDWKAFMLRVRECKIRLNSDQTSTTGTISVGTAKLNSDVRFD